MRPILQILSLAALLLTVLPSVLFFAGKLELDAVKQWMLLATLLWFVVTPLWMGRVAAKTETS